MRPAIRKRVLLTWEDIAAAASDLEPDVKELLDEIVSTRRVPVTGRGIAGAKWYLAGVTVQGHVGVGETQLSLPLSPCNGITIISGRNGTGKTSVADAIRHALSGGLPRGYSLVEDNLHCARSAITVAITNGSREVEMLCGDDRSVRWREHDVAGDAVPAEWIAAFERYKPALLYPELSPIIEKADQSHGFLADALELTALNDLLRDVDEIRAKGRDAARLVRDAHGSVVTCHEELDDQDRLSHPAPSGPTPPVLEADILRSSLERLPMSSPVTPELVEPWIIDDAVRSQVLDGIAILDAARAGVIRGAKTAQEALEKLLGGQGEHLAELRNRDVCPVCQTPGASWVATATAENKRLLGLLAGQTEAERAVEQGIGRLRSCLPRPLPAGTKAALADLDDPQAVARITQWNELAAEAAALSVDTATTVRLHALVAASADLSSWYTTARVALAQSRDDSISKRATFRTSAMKWLETLSEVRATVDRGAVADRLAGKVVAWIKETRDEVFSPIGKEVGVVWSALTCDVDLEMTDIVLTGGVRQARKVTIELSAQGTPVPAEVNKTALLSTGQRNALSLAMYVPRATQPASPFRFLVLDDPVHAFDSWRVRYLARHLADLADRYQIIVFTHDDRLWRELQAIGRQPTHLRLDRPPGYQSKIRVQEITRPSRRLLDDIDSILHQELTKPLGTAGARMAVTLALCRQAVDTEVVTLLDVLGRRLGKSDDQIRSEMASAYTTRDQMKMLNQHATTLGLQAVDYGPFEDLVTRLNGGAHGRAPALATLAECQKTVSQTRLLVQRIGTLWGRQ